MASVVMVALGRRDFCRRYTTDRPGHLWLEQAFRARDKTWALGLARSHGRMLSTATGSGNIHTPPALRLIDRKKKAAKQNCLTTF